MPAKKKYWMSRYLKLATALVAAAGILMLSVYAVGNKDKEKITDVKIDIQEVNGSKYITEKEIVSLLTQYAGKKLKDQSIGSLDLSSIETHFEKNRWIKKAILFVDNQNVLRISIQPEIPIARIFTPDGRSHYLTKDLAILPYNRNVTTRLPLFTNYPGDTEKLNENDSTMLNGIIKLAKYIDNNDFWMAQIDQIDMTPAGDFEMIPKLGNQVIRFGDASDYEVKFSKLLAFYRQVLSRTGWNTYRMVSVQFKDQVVAERRNAAEIRADSLAALRIMKQITEDARKKSSDNSVIQKPVRNPVVPAEVQRGSVERPAGDVSEEVPASYQNKAPVAKEVSGAIPSNPVPGNEDMDGKLKANEVKGNKLLNRVGTETLPTAKKETKKAEKKEGIKEDSKKEKQQIPKAVMPSKNGEQ